VKSAHNTNGCRYSSPLLYEQEIIVVMRKNWFLDQTIPKGGFVRLQASPLTREERVNETRIATTKWLTTCLDRDSELRTINSRRLNFLKKKERWEGYEQALVLIMTIQKETKRTEEIESWIQVARTPTRPILMFLTPLAEVTP